tara:strand:- start:1835 stop:2209 length:375 start_codon:yes stop_codon:yes gene_type:complete
MTRKSPQDPAKNFNMKTVKKGVDNKEYIVAKKSNGVKYWKILKPLEKKCNKLFKNKLSTNLGEYKKGRFQNYKQALAVTYSQVLRKDPKCNKYISSNKFKSKSTKIKKSTKVKKSTKTKSKVKK